MKLMYTLAMPFFLEASAIWEYWPQADPRIKKPLNVPGVNLGANFNFTAVSVTYSHSWKAQNQTSLRQKLKISRNIDDNNNSTLARKLSDKNLISPTFGGCTLYSPPVLTYSIFSCTNLISLVFLSLFYFFVTELYMLYKN